MMENEVEPTRPFDVRSAASGLRYRLQDYDDKDMIPVPALHCYHLSQDRPSGIQLFHTTQWIPAYGDGSFKPRGSIKPAKRNFRPISRGPGQT